MNKTIKELTTAYLDAIVILGTGIQGIPNRPDVSAEDIRSVAIMDMVCFMFYLSASDGEITWDEVDELNYYFDIHTTPQAVGDYIRKNNIYSTEFEKRIPPSIGLFVAAANVLKKYDEAYAVLEVYKAIGIELIRADNNVHPQEKEDYEIYISMIQRYIDENLENNNRSTSGFVKDQNNNSKSSGGVVAPKKG